MEPQLFPKRLILFFACLFGLTPFAIDSYLPAIPVIAKDLNTTTSQLAVTVSIYVFGMAVGQLIGGPLSDKRGRLPVILFGLFGFALFSLLLAISEQTTSFYVCRALQSVFGGISTVVVPAIIRDRASGKEAAKLFALIGLIMMLAPSIAPSIGTLILKTLSWQWIFYVSAILAMFVALAAVNVLPLESKTLTDDKEAQVPRGSIKAVVSKTDTYGYLLAQAFSFAVLLTFLTSSPHVFLNYFGLSEEAFSAVFVINVICVMTFNRINAWLLNKFEPEQLLMKFMSAQALGLVILGCALLIQPDNLVWVTTGLIGSVACGAAIGPNSNACYLKAFKENAGTASAIYGAVQASVGAGVSMVATMLTIDSLWPMYVLMLVSGAIAFGGARKSTASEPDAFVTYDEL